MLALGAVVCVGSSVVIISQAFPVKIYTAMATGDVRHGTISLALGNSMYVCIPVVYPVAVVEFQKKSNARP